MTQQKQPASDPFDCEVIRRALRVVFSVEPASDVGSFVDLPLVEAHRHAENLPDTPDGRRLALRSLLRKAIETMRPAWREPNHLDPSWRPYLILHEQYLRKVTVKALAGQMGLSRSSYFREQRRALDMLADALRTQQEKLAMEPVTPRHNLPAALTFFIGRRVELEQIAVLLADPCCRLLSLVGMGGSGKTRLALEAARAAVSHYRDGVFFLPLPAIEAAEIIPAVLEELLAVEILTALQRIFLGASALRGEPVAGLLESLRDKEALLILDNFEPWVNAAGLITRILQISPNLRLLVTSRERLRVAGEQVQEVRGLPLPAGQAGDDAVRSDAVQLFLQSARSAQAQFSPTGENLTHIAAICRLLDGLPLGIELAAGWTRALALREVQAALEADLQFLTSARRDIPERQRSLSAVLGYSWRSLSGATVMYAARLAVFQGGFTLEAARNVAGITPVMLAELVDQSLLTLAEGGRYALHPLLQQYAAQRLAAQAGDDAEARDRHAVYYLELLERQGTDIHGPRTRQALNVLNPELNNIRVAWRHACTTCRAELLSRSEKALFKYCATVGLFAEGERLIRTASECVRQLSRQEQPLPLLGTLLLTRSQLLTELGQFGPAVETAQEALALGTAHGDENLQARAHSALATAYSNQGEHAVARQHAEQAVAMAAALGLLGLGATARFTLANMAANENELERSVELNEAGLRLSRQAGDLRGECVALLNLGGNHGRLGHLTRARDTLQQALDLGQTLGEVLIETTARANLGNIGTSVGEFATAFAQFRQARAMYREMGHVYGQLAMLVNLSMACHALGNFDEALDCSRQGLRLAAEKPGNAIVEGFLHVTEGIALAALEDYPAAAQAYRLALATFDRVHLPHLGGDARAGLAAVELAQGKVQEALDHVLPIMGDLSMAALNPTLENALEPFGTLLTCCRVLRAAGHPRAADVLRTAYALLQQRADRISDAALRRAFLEDAPYNRALLAEYIAQIWTG